MDQTSHHLVKNDRPGEGWTAYFGGNTSRLKLRAYDRRGPLRLEFQWRVPRLQANQLNHLPECLHRSGPGPIWRGMARENAWPHPWYKALLNGSAISVLEDPREDSTLTRACEQIRKQFGSTLWACKLIGMTFDDFAVHPENPKQSVLARLVQYAQDAELMGYSPETLHKELDRWLKTSKSK